MFGLRKNNDEVFGAVIDISSGSVGVAVVESNHTKKLPTVIFAHRVLMRSGGLERKADDQMRQMREALFSASLVLSREGLQALARHNKHARITKILVSCSAPWSYTISRTVEYQNDTDVKISRTLVDDLVESAEEEIEMHVENAPIPQELGFQIVERATVDIRINDYPVHHPFGLKGQLVSLSHITGLVPKDVTKAIIDVQEKILPHTELRAHTLLLIVFCVLRDLIPNQSSYCIVNITSEATEFGIVSDDTLIASMHVPYGSGNLYRDIMKATGRTEADVTSLILSHQDRSLTQKAHDEVDTYFERYTSNLGKSFTEFFFNKSMPQSLVIIAEPYMTPLYKLEFDKMLKSATSTTIPVHVIDPEIIEQIMYDNVSDAYISLLCRFFHKLHGCGEIDSTK